MLLYNNIAFDYEGEHFVDVDGRKLEELSVPVIIDARMLCNYPVPFTLYEMDQECYPRIKAFHYDNRPFYTGASKNWTKEPKYEVPKMFQEYLNKDTEHNEVTNDDLER